MKSSASQLHGNIRFRNERTEGHLIEEKERENFTKLGIGFEI